jgi:hypothetical protein
MITFISTHDIFIGFFNFDEILEKSCQREVILGFGFDKKINNKSITIKIDNKNR